MDIFYTCNNYLFENNVPTCAVVNGMNFFVLNELECKILAPRIAFQKLMKAPEGKQLKIYRNVF